MDPQNPINAHKPSTNCAMAISRRDFLGASAAVTMACLLPAAIAPAAAPEPMPIIDTHQHLWDLDRFTLAWIGEGHPLRKNFLLSDYQHAAQGLNIVKTIYMEVAVAVDQQQAEADYVLALCKDPKNRIAGAVLGGQPEVAGFAPYIDKLKSTGFLKGIRAPLRGETQGDKFELDEKFVAGVQLLGREKLSFDILVQATELSRAIALVDAAPETRFILDHCGNPNLKFTPEQLEEWQRGIERLAQRKNVVCKVSGFIANSKVTELKSVDVAVVVDHVIDAFGTDRVMFAGDWPVCTKTATLREWVETLQAVVRRRPLVEQRNLFHDNAAKFYGIA